MATTCWRPTLLWRADDETDWHRVAMRLMVNDRWEASFVPARIGRHRFTVQAWWDAWATFRHDLAAKHAAGQEVDAGDRGRLPHDRGARPTRRSASRPRVSRRLSRWMPRQQVALLLAEETAAGDACGR